MFKRLFYRAAAASLYAAAVFPLTSSASQAAPTDCSYWLRMAMSELQHARPGIERERASDLVAAAVRAHGKGMDSDCHSELGEAFDILTQIDERHSSVYNDRSQEQYREEQEQEYREKPMDQNR